MSGPRAVLLALPFLVATAAGAQQPARPPAPGVSAELARERAATLSDLRYDVRLRIPAAVDQRVRGQVTIHLTREGSAPLVLDFADPSAVEMVRVDGEPAAFERVANHVIVPAELLPDGPTAITLSFTAGDAPLNRRDDFLYSLFVPDRAHEVLPVFDQPDLKARFRLELVVPPGWMAVANREVVRRDSADDGTVYTFAETEPLPTYLFAFAAGDFQVEEAVRDGRTLRLIHRETEADKVARSRDAIFDLHARALTWLEEYTGIPYPFGKFDIVAIPSFQYNGMEHPGAILYRASSLFLDESATRAEELGRASVIAHETAHMWFGDLVTMRWFSDVWMKEVFANLMAAKIVNPSFPDIDHELRFYLAHYPSAYSVDRTPGANSIRQTLENLSDAGQLYGAIIYQKAPIVMRQLEALIGEEPFREALRRYLDAHRFGNAGWPALVAELDAVTPLDVAAWSRVWVEEPGRPVVEVARGPAGVVLRPTDPAGEGRIWPQRTVVARVGPEPGAESPLILAGEPEAAVLPEGVPGDVAVLPNVRGMGYGLFRLDRETVQVLLRDLPGVEPPLARAVGWVDLWELMLEGLVEPAALLDLGLRMAAGETDELLAQQVVDDLTTLYWRHLAPEDRASMAAELEETLWNRLNQVDGASRKAAYFNAWRDLATTAAAVERMRDLWDGDSIPGLPLSERDRTRLALQLAVRDVQGAEEVLDAQAERIENPDRRARFEFVRAAASPDPAVRDAFFQSLARVENRSREEWVVAALALLHHPLRADASLRYLRPGLDLLQEVKDTGDIFFPTRWLAATLGGHASAEAAATVQRFIDDHPDYPPRLLGKILQQADPLFRAVRRGTGDG